jgi:thiol-disulfide isomerase/thioredoxin
VTRPKSSVLRGPVLGRAAAAPGWCLAVAAAVCALVVSGCSGGAIGQNTPLSSGQSFVGSAYNSVYYKPGSRPVAPRVSGSLLTGQKFSLAAQHGNVVVLNFWGSWCGPCRKEAPALAALAVHFGADHVRFIGDNVLDYPAAAEAFQRQFNVGYPSLNDQNEQIVLAFHSTVPPYAIPSTLIIDKTGHIAARVVGGVSYDGLRTLIDEVLGERG